MYFLTVDLMTAEADVLFCFGCFCVLTIWKLLKYNRYRCLCFHIRIIKSGHVVMKGGDSKEPKTNKRPCSRGACYRGVLSALTMANQ